MPNQIAFWSLTKNELWELMKIYKGKSDQFERFNYSFEFPDKVSRAMFHITPRDEENYEGGMFIELSYVESEKAIWTYDDMELCFDRFDSYNPDNDTHYIIDFSLKEEENSDMSRCYITSGGNLVRKFDHNGLPMFIPKAK